jgi:hypothetical protein
MNFNRYYSLGRVDIDELNIKTVLFFFENVLVLYEIRHGVQMILYNFIGN